MNTELDDELKKQSSEEEFDQDQDVNAEEEMKQYLDFLNVQQQENSLEEQELIIEEVKTNLLATKLNLYLNMIECKVYDEVYLRKLIFGEDVATALFEKK